MPSLNKINIFSFFHVSIKVAGIAEKKCKIIKTNSKGTERTSMNDLQNHLLKLLKIKMTF